MVHFSSDEKIERKTRISQQDQAEQVRGPGCGPDEYVIGIWCREEGETSWKWGWRDSRLDESRELEGPTKTKKMFKRWCIRQRTCEKFY